MKILLFVIFPTLFSFKNSVANEECKNVYKKENEILHAYVKFPNESLFSLNFEGVQLPVPNRFYVQPKESAGIALVGGTRNINYSYYSCSHEKIPRGFIEVGGISGCQICKNYNSDVFQLAEQYEIDGYHYKSFKGVAGFEVVVIYSDKLYLQINDKNTEIPRVWWGLLTKTGKTGVEN